LYSDDSDGFDTLTPVSSDRTIVSPFSDNPGSLSSVLPPSNSACCSVDTSWACAGVRTSEPPACGTSESFIPVVHVLSSVSVFRVGSELVLFWSSVSLPWNGSLLWSAIPRLFDSKERGLRSVRLEQSRISSVLPAQVLTLQRRSRFSGPSTQVIDKDPRIDE